MKERGSLPGSSWLQWETQGTEARQKRDGGKSRNKMDERGKERKVETRGKERRQERTVKNVPTAFLG